jgi:hypothetical protein
MAYALVGTAGAATLGSSGAAVTPAWGTGENRTLNNLLILWVVGFGVTTFPTTPSGWSQATGLAGTSMCAAVYFKIAAGSDAAPTIAALTSQAWAGALAEFSGGVTAAPVDQSMGSQGTTSPLSSPGAGPDLLAGELVVASGGAFYNASATKTISHTFNNGATSTERTNNATSTPDHYDFSYGITDSNALTDTDTFAFTTTKITGAAVANASFQVVLPPPPPITMFSAGSINQMPGFEQMPGFA